MVLIMNRNEFLAIREQLMENIDAIMDSHFGEVEYKDEVVAELCDMVCETMDPVGLPEEEERGHPGVVNRPNQRWVSTVCR